MPQTDPIEQYVTDYLSLTPSDYSVHHVHYLEFAHDQLVSILRRFSPDYPCQLDIGLGWIPLILNLDRKLAFLFPDYKIYQIKEKFGQLRYYYECSPPSEYPDEISRHNANTLTTIIQDVVAFAEIQSKSICEVCAGVGKSHVSDGYLRTVCSKHRL